jgi:isocitrate/isopropylmalate dehydrogenase
MTSSAMSLVPATRKSNYTIASIPGDGIGIEVIAATLSVLETLTQTLNMFTLSFTHLPWGSAYYQETGAYLPPDALATLRQHDA